MVRWRKKERLINRVGKVSSYFDFCYVYHCFLMFFFNLIIFFCLINSFYLLPLMSKTDYYFCLLSHTHTNGCLYVYIYEVQKNFWGRQYFVHGNTDFEKKVKQRNFQSPLFICMWRGQCFAYVWIFNKKLNNIKAYMVVCIFV